MFYVICHFTSYTGTHQMTAIECADLINKAPDIHAAEFIP
jgi:hypothetical protein